MQLGELYQVHCIGKARGMAAYINGLNLKVEECRFGFLLPKKVKGETAEQQHARTQ